MSDDPDAWRKRAACRGMDPDKFVPARHGSFGDAPEVCARCPVRSDCLATALLTRESFGMWGGLGVKQRRHLANLLSESPRFADRLPAADHPVTGPPPPTGAERHALLGELFDLAEPADPEDVRAAAELLGTTPQVVTRDLLALRPDPHRARRERALIGTPELIK